MKFNLLFLLVLFLSSAWGFLSPCRTRIIISQQQQPSQRNVFSVDSLNADCNTVTESAASSLLLAISEIESGVSSSIGSIISNFFGIALVLSIGVFYYANVVYTPEILENSKQMRLQVREIDRQKLLAAIQQHINDGLDLNELRAPLETTFGMTIEEYVSSVEEESVRRGGGEEETEMTITSADESLARILKTYLL